MRITVECSISEDREYKTFHRFRKYYQFKEDTDERKARKSAIGTAIHFCNQTYPDAYEHEVKIVRVAD